MTTIVGKDFSDDYFTIDGDIDDEVDYWPFNDNNKAVLLFSDGTKTDVVYDGVWKFPIINRGCALKEVVAEDPDEDIGERLVFDSTLQWVEFQIFRNGVLQKTQTFKRQ